MRRHPLTSLAIAGLVALAAAGGSEAAHFSSTGTSTIHYPMSAALNQFQWCNYATFHNGGGTVTIEPDGTEQIGDPVTISYCYSGSGQTTITSSRYVAVAGFGDATSGTAACLPTPTYSPFTNPVTVVLNPGASQTTLISYGPTLLRGNASTSVSQQCGVIPLHIGDTITMSAGMFALVYDTQYSGPNPDSGATASITYTIDATILSSTYTIWVPVASHAAGLNSSQWRTDLGLLNTSTGTAGVRFNFFGSGGVVTNTTSVAPGSESILTDIVGQLGGSGSGAIEILSDQPLRVTSRTYNQVSSSASCYPNGTQGQDYPAVVPANGLNVGQTAYLAGLTEDSSYRCNIGVVNTGTGAASALVKLYDGAGTYLTQYTVSLTPGQWSQATQPFKNQAGEAGMTAGYATVTVQSGSGVLAFASVIDNITNDPTTVVMQQSSPGLVIWVPVASHASGLNSSQWRSDLGLLNCGTTAANNVQVQFYGTSGTVSQTTSVAAGEESILSDVVEWLGGSGSGALEITSAQPLEVTSRTYNQVSSSASCYPDGTQGQDYPAVVSATGLSAGQSAYLAGLTENTAYRCNIGLVNTSTASATALVKLYNGAGTYLAQYTVSLTPGQWSQATQPFKNDASQTAMSAGYATITVQSGSGVFAFASVIDNVTNDPTTVVMQP